MNTGALLRILARRWYVLIAAVIIAGFAFVFMARTGGAYVSEAQVVFIAPGTDAVGAFDEGYRDTLVNFAAAIEREFHNGEQSNRLAEHAPLFGAGVTQGYQVVLPNSGGQWENSFATPGLSVSVAGPSAEWVSATMSSLLERIDTLADERQVASGVAPENMIVTDHVPTELVISYIGSSRGTQARALLALAAVGLGVGAAAAVSIDRRALSRRSPAHVTSPPPINPRKVRVQ